MPVLGHRLVLRSAFLAETRHLSAAACARAAPRPLPRAGAAAAPGLGGPGVRRLVGVATPARVAWQSEPHRLPARAQAPARRAPVRRRPQHAARPGKRSRRLAAVRARRPDLDDRLARQRAALDRARQTTSSSSASASPRRRRGSSCSATAGRRWRSTRRHAVALEAGGGARRRRGDRRERDRRARRRRLPRLRRRRRRARRRAVLDRARARARRGARSRTATTAPPTTRRTTRSRAALGVPRPPPAARSRRARSSSCSRTSSSRRRRRSGSSARGRRWELVPVVIQDPDWEQSFPRSARVVLPLADPRSGAVLEVRLTRREARAWRERARARAGPSCSRGFAALGVDPVLLDSSDPDAVQRTLPRLGRAPPARAGGRR